MPNSVLSLGRVGLFFGVQTFSYSLSDWEIAASFCSSHGVNFAIIKVLDIGSNRLWYNGGADIPSIVTVFSSHGIKVLPYAFVGSASGYPADILPLIKGATPILQSICHRWGCLCLDVEGEGWVNRPDMGEYLASQLANLPGIALSLPANPVQAGMLSSFAPLMRLQPVLMPMAYSNFLGGVYRQELAQLGNFPIAPTFDLSGEFGANDPVNLSKEASTFQQASYWYDGFARNNPILFDSCIHAFGGSMQVYGPTAPDFTHWFTMIDATHWKCNGSGCIIQFGILDYYTRLSLEGNLPEIGLPLTNETPVTVGGSQYVLQAFERALVIYDPGHVVDNPYGGRPAFLVHVASPQFNDMYKLIPAITVPPPPVPPPQVDPAILKAIQDDLTKLATDLARL